MTEEIIIDDVDVAGCVRLQDDKISCDLGGECKGWDNCYYKQLKRLEQENKELKEKAPMKLIAKNNTYRSALEEIREIEELAYYSKGILEEPLSQRDFILDAINNYEQRRIKILNKINEVLQ